MNEMEDAGLVSRSYLTVFFMDVNNLKDALTGYRSIILRLELKTGTESNPNDLTKGLDEQLKNAVISWSDQVRHCVERCQIAATALKQIEPSLETKTLDIEYEKIIKSFAPDLENVSNYTFEINKIFVKGTIEKILNKMENFYEQFSSK